MNNLDAADMDKDGDVDLVLAEHRGTRRIAAWQKKLKADAAFMPPLDEVGALRRLLLIEIHVFALIPILAAMMARGVGYGN